MAMTQPNSTTQPAHIDRLPVWECAVWTVEGEYLSDGRAVVIDRGSEVEARVTGLSAPGAVLNLLYGRGLRRYVLTFGQRPALDVELVETLWQGNGRRMCRFLCSALPRPGQGGR